MRRIVNFSVCHDIIFYLTFLEVFLCPLLSNSLSVAKLKSYQSILTKNKILFSNLLKTNFNLRKEGSHVTERNIFKLHFLLSTSEQMHLTLGLSIKCNKEMLLDKQDLQSILFCILEQTTHRS